MRSGIPDQLWCNRFIDAGSPPRAGKIILLRAMAEEHGLCSPSRSLDPEAEVVFCGSRRSERDTGIEEQQLQAP